MSQSMSAATWSGPARPLNALAILVFALFSFAGFYFMRIQNALNGVPVDFDRICMSGQWSDGTPIKQTYTGVKAIDFAFTWLVPAFLTGPAGWDEGVRLQQVHFLVNFFAVVCIWNIEASRKRNQGKIISYITSKKDSYLASGRELRPGYAESLLPAILVGYLVPTLALYIPWGDLNITQNLTALWQPAPVFPNVLLLILVPLLSSSSSSRSASETSDVKHLKRIYLAIGVVSMITHLATLYVCLTSSNPQLSLSYIFLPNKATWKLSTALGLHYIFQWDFWIIFTSSLVWCWIAVTDTLRSMQGGSRIWQKLVSAINLVLVSLVAGPGTTLALVWNWREDRLVKLPEIGRKPKAA
ncbi:FAD binding domain-containing protein [Seiridium cupressi]